MDCDCEIIHYDMVEKVKKRVLDEETLLSMADFYKALSDSTRIKIIDVLYGEEYKDAVIPFIILIIGFFFTATFKNLLTNIIFCLHKIWFGVMLNIVSMIVNVILDIIFVWMFGYIGVGIATLIINILSSIISVIYFRKCIKELENKN